MDTAAHALWAAAGLLMARRLWADTAEAAGAPDQPRRTVTPAQAVHPTASSPIAPLLTAPPPKVMPLKVTPRTVALTMAMAALPDLIHLLPLAVWWVFGSGTAADLYAYAIASPGQEPPMPLWVAHYAHHLHCIMHSAITTAAAALLLWLALRALWIPLLGWWSHVVIDVFTHSAAFYPSPVLYPFTQQGFDGIAWNTPWFMLLNYALLAAVWGWLGWALWRARRRPDSAPA